MQQAAAAAELSGNSFHITSFHHHLGQSEHTTSSHHNVSRGQKSGSLSWAARAIGGITLRYNPSLSARGLTEWEMSRRTQRPGSREKTTDIFTLYCFPPTDDNMQVIIESHFASKTSGQVGSLLPVSVIKYWTSRLSSVQTWPIILHVFCSVWIAAAL